MTVNVLFRWTLPGENVSLRASFLDNWNKSEPLQRQPTGDRTCIIPLNGGVHTYKFVVDDTWVEDVTAEIVTDGCGNRNNVVRVPEYDYLVLLDCGTTCDWKAPEVTELVSVAIPVRNLQKSIEPFDWPVRPLHHTIPCSRCALGMVFQWLRHSCPLSQVLYVHQKWLYGLGLSINGNEGLSWKFVTFGNLNIENLLPNTPDCYKPIKVEVSVPREPDEGVLEHCRKLADIVSRDKLVMEAKTYHWLLPFTI